MKKKNKNKIALPNESASLFVIIAVGFILYSFMLSAPFKALDDQISIVQNQDIRSFANLGKIFKGSFFGEGYYYRPLVSFSFAVEYFFFKLNPFYYHLTNLVLHLTNASLVFFLIRFIFKENTTAFFTSLLFVMHPVNAEAVWNIADRAILLCALFIFSSFLCFLYSREKKAGGRIVLSLLLFISALISKESAAMFPFVLCAWLMFRNPEEKLSAGTFRASLPFFVIVGGYVVLRKALGFVNVYAWDGIREALLGFFTFLRGVLVYLTLIVFPFDLHFDRSLFAFESFFQPQLIVTLMIWALIIGLIFAQRGRLSSITKFFAAWFALEMFPVSQLITAIGVSPGVISTAEHFLYIPSISLFVLLVCGTRSVLYANQKKKYVSKRLAQAVIVVFLIVCALFTLAQNLYARSPVATLERAARFGPHNGRVLLSLGLELAQRGRFKEAEHYFLRALETDPRSARAQISLGKALCDQGRYLEGIAVYESVREPGKMKALLENNLRLSYLNLIRQYEERVRENPDNPDLYYSLGVMQIKADRLRDAVKNFYKTLSIDPGHRNAAYNLRAALAALEHMDQQ